MPEPSAPEAQPQKDNLGEKILGFCHDQYNKTVEFAFGKQVYVPFTDRKVSRPELWLGLPVASAFITSAITEIPIIMLGVASKGELFSQNPEVAVGLGLLAAAGGVGVGLAAATGIEVMSGIRTMSEKVAAKLHEKAKKRYEKAKQILGKDEEKIMGPGLTRGVKAVRDFISGQNNK
ncbi:hypothetical protein A3E73_01495 [Candidatus Beckwithbacteria bacterium RIFCSPHIGHO2_12_FULL_47_17]|uniref:Uncharacterized protein n=1 Tax=Candidatus Beckwithbacteria bacterium RIFCSPHIGHO2_12_FULL_47_17 TaxID=1797460 RepID=A0A1F5DK12_9BACT|nr:MAG: hypothetical protein A3E73_01495 [Candidatus Beckwithbacteria bacterium RIFCSPHIGHO2_12_FULL_47_17]